MAAFRSQVIRDWKADEEAKEKRARDKLEALRNLTAGDFYKVPGDFVDEELEEFMLHEMHIAYDKWIRGTRPFD